MKQKIFVGILIVMLLISSFLFSSLPFVHASGISRIQGNAQSTGQSSPVSVTLASSPTSGNMLILTSMATSSTAFRTITSINETGVTWTYQISCAGDNSNPYRKAEIWAGVVGVGGSVSISVVFSGNPERAVIVDVCEYSGLVTSGFLDKNATNTGSSANGDTGTTSATSVANELWIGLTGTMSTVYTVTQSNPTNNFTLLDGAQYHPSGVYSSLGFLEKIVSTTGTANSGTTISHTNVWIGCICTFKAVTVAWHITETWKINAYALKWFLTESWRLNLHNFTWFLSERWRLNLYVLNWFLTETWRFNLYGLKWFLSEQWRLNVCVLNWFLTESWKLGLHNFTWFFSEQWRLNAYTLKWFLTEQWKFNAYVLEWFFAELWSLINVYGMAITVSMPVVYTVEHWLYGFVLLVFGFAFCLFLIIMQKRKKRKRFKR